MVINEVCIIIYSLCVKNFRKVLFYNNIFNSFLGIGGNRLNFNFIRY